MDCPSLNQKVNKKLKQDYYSSNAWECQHASTIWTAYNSLLHLISPLGKLCFIYGYGMNYIWQSNNHFMNNSSTNMMLLPHDPLPFLVCYRLIWFL